MLPERLALLRKKKNKTQEDMAKLLGITRPAYTAYETGRRQPDYGTLINLADYFNTTLDYLLGRTDDPSPLNENGQFPDVINDPAVNHFFKDFLNAPKERREELQRFWGFIREQEKNEKSRDND